MGLWLETFCSKKQTETAGGPFLVTSAVSFQVRPGVPYPRPNFISKVKDWQKSFFLLQADLPCWRSRLSPFHSRSLCSRQSPQRPG
jgi:hypothetical protein